MTYIAGIIIALIINFFIARMYRKNNLEPDWGDTSIRIVLVLTSWVGVVIFLAYLISTAIADKKPPTWL